MNQRLPGINESPEAGETLRRSFWGAKKESATDT